MVTFETHGGLIYVKGYTKHPNYSKYKLYQHKKRLQPTIWNYFWAEVWSGGFGKQRMPWSSCGVGLYLDLINCSLKNFRVPCPLAVAWISFILAVMERVHRICKYPNGDGYPLGWRFWRPDNTHHILLLLQTMPSYFSTVPIAERTVFIFYPACFLLEAVSYQHNPLVNFWEWGCTSP